MDALHRAEQILQRLGRTTDEVPANRLPQQLPVLDDNDCFQSVHDTMPAADERAASEPPIALLVEQRDEVFARLAADMVEAGMWVIRAESAAEALISCETYAPSVVVASVDLADQSGWLLAGKLRLLDPGIRVWLYRARSSSYDEDMAAYLYVDELLDYGGDLLGLSDAISELTANRRGLSSAGKNVRGLAAA